MFKHLGRFCASYPWIVCAAWIVAGGLLMFTAPSWDARTQDDDVRFLPNRCASVRAYQILEKAFPKDVFASRLIFAIERDESALTEKDLALVDDMVADLRKLSKKAPDLKIGSITCHNDGLIGNRLTSKDKQCTLIQVSLGTPFLALQTQKTVDRAQEVLQERIKKAGDDVPKLYTTGQAGIGRDLVTATGSSLDHTTIATVILVVVILLFVYRSPLLALIPLITIGVSVWVALNLLAIMTLIPGVYLVNISKVFAIVILYGAGTDYCLFLISRYREELENGSSLSEALSASVGTVGGALTASAGTVMCGLGLMALAEFAKVRYSGPGIALSLAVALLASLTLTPALLRVFGRVVFWPVRAPRPKPLLRMGQMNQRQKGLWEWISRRVVKRPVLVWSLSVALLLPLAILGLQVRADYRATSQLSYSSESLKGLAALKKHFPAGETGPMTVLLVSSKEWDTPAGRVEIDHLSRGFAKLDNVHEVRSLTRPLGEALPQEQPQKGIMLVANIINSIKPGLVDNLMGGARNAAREHYVSTMAADDGSQTGPLHVTRLDVVMKSDPFDAASLETMKQIQTWLDRAATSSTLRPTTLRSETYGVMVSAHDLSSVTESDRLRVNALIIAGIFLILLIIVRRPVMALYLLATVLFSYYATLGATMLAGYFWAGEVLFVLDWRVLFFLFTILIAVGEDYNIFLMSRTMQEQKKFGAREGIRRALARTGGTITSCGLIMAGTFATLMLANLNSLLQIGFALAFGVLIDTFIVRPFLVPTFALLLGRINQQGKPPEKKPPQTSAPHRKKVNRVPPALRMAG